MYAFIEGKVEEKTKTSILLNNHGIGYEIFVTNNTLSALELGKEAKVYTYFHVREDVQALYGFLNQTEKQMFLDLLNINGVGAKMALNILSGIAVTDLLHAIATGDVRLLSSIKGVGKKTAERILLELKGKFSESEMMNLLTTSSDTSAGFAMTPANEAIEVLTNMGIAVNLATQMVKAIALPSDTAEQIIEKCLKNM